MKWWLYIFLLANLATFFWHYQPGLFRPETAKQHREDSESNPQLVLLREYMSVEQPAKSQQTSAQEASCFNLGPFLYRKNALQVNKALTQAGIVSLLQVDKNKTRPGFWVLIPPESDRKSARKTIDRLKKKKVKDYFLVATGSQKNAISLGVFSRSDLAQRRLAEIKKLGFTVMIDKVDLPKREYWLEWPVSIEASPDMPLLDSWRKKFPGIGHTKKACKKNPA